MRRWLSMMGVAVLVALCMWGAPASANPSGETIYLVTNTSGDQNAVGSLPWAVHQANFATPGFDRIRFAIPGPGPHRIRITSTLYVTDQVDIDATSQPGYQGQPLVWVLGGPTVPSIFLLTNNPWGSNTSSVSSIHGFGLFDYTANAVTILPGSQGNWIQKNWMGFMPDANRVLRVRDSGRSDAAFTRGVGVSSSHNVIRWNTISGVENGVTIGLPTLEGAPYVNNAVSENRIGTNPEGTSVIGYGNEGDGVFLGEGAGANWVGPGNVISGNGSAGVELLNRANVGSVIFRNHIGLDVTGRVALGNGELGILVSGWAQGNAIGGPWGGNLIAGNRLGGISIGVNQWGGGHGNWVVGNTLGLDVEGRPVGAQAVGIIVGSGSQRNTVSDNVVGGHSTHGILVGDQTWRGTARNGVFANHIGRAADGSVHPNGAYGVLLWNARSNWITGNFFGVNVLGNVHQLQSSGNAVR